MLLQCKCIIGKLQLIVESGYVRPKKVNIGDTRKMSVLIYRSVGAIV